MSMGLKAYLGRERGLGFRVDGKQLLDQVEVRAELHVPGEAQVQGAVGLTGERGGRRVSTL